MTPQKQAIRHVVLGQDGRRTIQLVDAETLQPISDPAGYEIIGQSAGLGDLEGLGFIKRPKKAESASTADAQEESPDYRGDRSSDSGERPSTESFYDYDIERTEANNYGFANRGAAADIIRGIGRLSPIPGSNLLAAGLLSTDSTAVQAAYKDVFGRERPVTTHLKGAFRGTDSSGYVSSIEIDGKQYEITLAPDPENPQQITPGQAKNLIGRAETVQEIGPVAEARGGFVQRAADAISNWSNPQTRQTPPERPQVPLTEEATSGFLGATQAPGVGIGSDRLAAPSVPTPTARPAQAGSLTSFMDFARNQPEAQIRAPAVAYGDVVTPEDFTTLDTTRPYTRDVGLPNTSMDVLQGVDRARNQLGLEALTINSAYRDPAYNKAVGGRPGSQHKLGNAVDIRIPEGVDPVALVDTLAAQGFTGFGVGGNYIHADRRATPATWSYPNASASTVKAVRDRLTERGFDPAAGTYMNAPSTLAFEQGGFVRPPDKPNAPKEQNVVGRTPLGEEDRIALATLVATEANFRASPEEKAQIVYSAINRADQMGVPIADVIYADQQYTGMSPNNAKRSAIEMAVRQGKFDSPYAKEFTSGLSVVDGILAGDLENTIGRAGAYAAIGSPEARKQASWGEFIGDYAGNRFVDYAGPYVDPSRVGQYGFVGIAPEDIKNYGPHFSMAPQRQYEEYGAGRLASEKAATELRGVKGADNAPAGLRDIGFATAAATERPAIQGYAEARADVERVLGDRGFMSSPVAPDKTPTTDPFGLDRSESSSAGDRTGFTSRDSDTSSPRGIGSDRYASESSGSSGGIGSDRVTTKSSSDTKTSKSGGIGSDRAADKSGTTSSSSKSSGGKTSSSGSSGGIGSDRGADKSKDGPGSIGDRNENW